MTDISLRMLGIALAGCLFAGVPARAANEGVEHVIYAFQNNSSDGANPAAGLINVKGTLFGTTPYGGSSGAGTVFSVTPAGVEKVIYAFQNSGGDGTGPVAGLINVNGTLFGTTRGGGSNNGGTVFLLSQGFEGVLYSFQYNGSDGANPVAGLIDVNGTLYGTTPYGGSSGAGTVFSLP